MEGADRPAKSELVDVVFRLRVGQHNRDGVVRHGAALAILGTSLPGTTIFPLRPPATRSVTGNAPAGNIFSANIIRRHLTTGQRAMAVAKLAQFRCGDVAGQRADARNQGPSILTVEEAAKLGHVSHSTVDQAKIVSKPCAHAAICARQASGGFLIAKHGGEPGWVTTLAQLAVAGAATIGPPEFWRLPPRWSATTIRGLRTRWWR